MTTPHDQEITWRRYLPPPWVSAMLGLATVVWLVYSLREIVFLLVIGYSIAYVLDPILSWLERHNIRRQVGIFVVGAGLLIILLLLLVTIVPRLLSEGARFVDNFPEYLKTAKTNASVLAAYLDAYIPSKMLDAGGVQGIVENVEISSFVDKNLLSKIGSGLVKALLKGYSVTLTLLNLALLPFIVYYLALDLKALHYSILLALPKRRRQPIRKLFREIDHTVEAFIRGQMVVAMILSVLYAIGLALVGVDLWFAIALLSGIGSMIPYVGGLFGLCLATLMGLVTFGTLSSLLAVWLVYAVVQGIEGTFITPWIVGNKVGLSPLAVILALFAGASLFGIVGVFFAIPVAASLKVLSNHAARTIFRAPGGGLYLPTND